MAIKISFKNMNVGDLEVHAIIKTGEGEGIHAGTLITKDILEKHELEEVLKGAVRDLLNTLKKKE